MTEQIDAGRQRDGYTSLRRTVRCPRCDIFRDRMCLLTHTVLVIIHKTLMLSHGDQANFLNQTRGENVFFSKMACISILFQQQGETVLFFLPGKITGLCN